MQIFGSLFTMTFIHGSSIRSPILEHCQITHLLSLQGKVQLSPGTQYILELKTLLTVLGSSTTAPVLLLLLLQQRLRLQLLCARHRVSSLFIITDNLGHRNYYHRHSIDNKTKTQKRLSFSRNLPKTTQLASVRARMQTPASLALKVIDIYQKKSHNKLHSFSTLFLLLHCFFCLFSITFTLGQ